MDDASEEYLTFAHPGTEFLHLLEGELVYRHGNRLYHMHARDSLTFDGETPHGRHDHRTRAGVRDHRRVVAVW